MKNIVFLFLFLVPAFLFAQYPTGTNKSRLGYQTTGDGLIWRGVAADTAIKPRTTANAYFQLDTVNRVLRRYIATQGSWQEVGGGSTNVDSLIYATRYWVGSNFFPLQGGTLTGTGGAGFIGFPSQVSAPGTPASGLNVYAQGSSFNWKGTDGYERQFASTLTGGRTYTLPDVNGTFALGTGTADRSARWSATNTLAAGNFTDNGTKLEALLPFQFKNYTTAALPTGVTRYTVWDDTKVGPAWYQGSRWAYGLESTFNRGTSTRVPFFDANGQISDVSTLRYNYANGYLYTPNFISPKIETYPDDVFFLGVANANRIRFYTPTGTQNNMLYYVNNVYVGQFTAGVTQFAINHTNQIYIAQQGGTSPYVAIGGSGVSIGSGTSTSASYPLHIQGASTIGVGRGTVAQRPTIIASTTPFWYNTDSTQLEYGEGVGVWRQIATRAYVRSLAVTDTWLGSRLATSNVSISEQTRDLRLGLRGFYVDSIYINSQTVPENTIILNRAFFPSGGITATTGNSNSVFNGLIAGAHGGYGNYAAHGAIINANSSGSNFNNAQGINTVIYGEKNQAIGYNVTTGSSSVGRNTMYGRNIAANNFNDNILIGDSLTSTANGQVKIGNSLNNSQLFFGQKFIYDYDTFVLQLSDYGTGTKEASDLSKTQSNYITGFATDGTVLDLNVDTLLKKEKYFTITSTSSPQTLSNNFSDNLINQGGTQATFTLTFPASPVDGQVLKITYNNAITTLTLDGNGNTIVGSAVTTGVAGSQRAFKFYTGIGWIKLY